MSLLMKALEKAAKDRGEAGKEPAVAAGSAPVAAPAPSLAPSPAAAPAKSELSLEPIGLQPAARMPAEPAPRAAPAPQRPAPSAAPAPAPAAPPSELAQAQASTVLQAQSAGTRASGGAMAYVRAHPVLISGSLASLVGVAFGVYVYLQIFHPGFFVGAPPLASKGPPPPLAQAPISPPAQPIPTAELLKDPSTATAPAAAPPPPAARLEPEPAPTPDEVRRSAIVVSPGSAQPVLDPRLGQAYAALQSGQSEEARRLYEALAKAEPKNVDAHIALAALAVERGDTEDATRRYLQVLELEPRNALAQSGLIALLGRADPLAAEAKLKQLITREPSAHLYFILGNVYADQSQWSAAQLAYFQAHHLEPGNADYAFNLAVGLDHVSQPKLALNYYRQAVKLASARGRAHFNLPQAQERIGRLAAQVE